MPLAAALGKEWNNDQHMVSYFVLDSSGRPVADPPRIKKEDLAQVQSAGLRVLHNFRAADADIPEHKTQNITPEVVAQLAERLRNYRCIWYQTRGGVRIIQCLSRPLTPAEYEVTIKQWLPELDELLRDDLVEGADTNCMDWTRFMRLPRVVRQARDGSNKNYWSTPIHWQQSADELIDPGDCTPPPPKPKLWRPPATKRDRADGCSAYGRAVLRNQAEKLRAAPAGARNHQLIRSAFVVGMYVGGGEISADLAVRELTDAVDVWSDSPTKDYQIIESRIDLGSRSPKTAPQSGKLWGR